MRVFRVVGVLPPQVAGLVAPGPSEKQAEERERLPPRPTGGFPVAEQDLLIFEGERNSHVHPDLFPVHQVKDVPGGALSTTKGSHQDVGVKNGFCVRDGGEPRDGRFLFEPHTAPDVKGFHYSIGGIPVLTSAIGVQKQKIRL